MKLIRKEFIFNDPAPTPQCHASTIVKTGDNHFVAAWFGGEAEGKNDVRIWVSHYFNNTWSKPQSIPSPNDTPHWNPVLMQYDKQTLCLFYKVGYKIPDWQTMFTLSKDGGKTWSKSQELVADDTSGGRGPVKNKAIFSSNGNVLAPASVERGPWRPFIDIYNEERIWKKVEIPVDLPDSEKINIIQPTLWEYPQGHIHALMRTNLGYIYRSDSHDYGQTWSNVYPSSIPNNNSGIDCALLNDNRLVLVCNPISKNWGKRSPLSVLISSDNGSTFEEIMDLETADGEFSYPAIVSSDNHVFITYTWNRQKICFCELEL